MLYPLSYGRVRRTNVLVYCDLLGVLRRCVGQKEAPRRHVDAATLGTGDVTEAPVVGVGSGAADCAAAATN